MPDPRPQPVASLDDQRLMPYRNLKDRDLARNHGLFVCEGEHLVRRLLASRLTTHSILATESRAEALLPAVPAGVPIYTASKAVLAEIVGFAFHRGVLAVGGRPEPVSAASLMPAETLLVCPELKTPENLGGIVRTAAALGADGLVLGEQGVDPFNRKALRASMGAAFSLPIVRSPDLAEDLKLLGQVHDVERVATVLDEGAEPLEAYVPARRVAVLLGNEPEGLGEAWAGRCDRRVRIPMRGGIDSLNVGVAAGIVLHAILSSRRK